MLHKKTPILIYMLFIIYVFIYRNKTMNFLFFKVISKQYAYINTTDTTRSRIHSAYIYAYTCCTEKNEK